MLETQSPGLKKTKTINNQLDIEVRNNFEIHSIQSGSEEYEDRDKANKLI